MQFNFNLQSPKQYNLKHMKFNGKCYIEIQNGVNNTF